MQGSSQLCTHHTSRRRGLHLLVCSCLLEESIKPSSFCLCSCRGCGLAFTHLSLSPGLIVACLEPPVCVCDLTCHRRGLSMHDGARWLALGAGHRNSGQTATAQKTRMRIRLPRPACHTSAQARLGLIARAEHQSPHLSCEIGDSVLYILEVAALQLVSSLMLLDLHGRAAYIAANDQYMPRLPDPRQAAAVSATATQPNSHACTRTGRQGPSTGPRKEGLPAPARL